MSQLQPAAPRIFAAMARAIAPRKRLTVSQWADADPSETAGRILSSKGSAEPGRWRTSRNPPLAEPMDCMSTHSSVRAAVLMFPIQIGKTEVAINSLGYWMTHAPGPIMVCLPGEVSQGKWIAQKLNPALDETPAMRRVLTSVATRDSANQRSFKDFEGGQLYIEHAGSPQRLKSTTVKYLVADEFSQFATELRTGDDPVALLEGRTSSFPSSYKHLFISSPGVRGICRTEAMWERSDQRRYEVPCPHCSHLQPLVWAGLHWSTDASTCWYVCRECGACIEEFHKTAMIAAGRWVAANPGASVRGYHINGLYYPVGLGPRWLDLVRMWRAAQGDPAALKTFINDRLAETFEDPAMRAVRLNLIADRAESYELRVAVPGVLAITAGVDTQDDRLAVCTVGWGRGLACWVLDYVELPGDPALPEVWVALSDLLNRPVPHAAGGVMGVEAVAIDAGGHRTEAVKDFCRRRTVRRPLVIFGAVPNNAPVLSKGKLQDVNFRDRHDKRGVHIHHVGTVGIKHLLYSRLSVDADTVPEKRLVHFTDQLPEEFLPGLVSEVYNPSKNRFEKRRGGARNEPLDTWVYAYAATHHPELRLHRLSRAEWDAREARRSTVNTSLPAVAATGETPKKPPSTGSASRKTSPPPSLGSDRWSGRL